MTHHPCTHALLKRVIDLLGPMATNPTTGVTEAPVLKWHYQCVECPARFVAPIEIEDRP